MNDLVLYVALLLILNTSVLAGIGGATGISILSFADNHTTMWNIA